jgi:hypothetical protein
MSVLTEDGGHSVSIKPKAAGIASPGLEPDQLAKEADCAGATRAIAVGAAALRADHCANLLRWRGKNIKTAKSRK